jgi:hypothetical protein
MILRRYRRMITLAGARHPVHNARANKLFCRVSGLERMLLFEQLATPLLQ